jgi:pimeloyl-ACP methyl ester carboxylesterase
MLTHRVDGSGEPLLLLNGGLMSITAWDPFLPMLAAHRKVIRCDFSGQLYSKPPYATTLEEHARDVIELLDALAIEQVDIAGVSFGGLVGMFTAATYPDRVKRLTVINATDRTVAFMRQDAAEASGIAERAAAGLGGGVELFRRVFDGTWSDRWLAEHPGFIEERLKHLALLPDQFYAGAASIIRVLATLDLTPYLGDIRAETLVIGGEFDRVFPIEHSRAIADAIPGAKLTIVPDTGHGLLFEQPDAWISPLISTNAAP